MECIKKTPHFDKKPHEGSSTAIFQLLRLQKYHIQKKKYFPYPLIASIYPDTHYKTIMTTL